MKVRLYVEWGSEADPQDGFFCDYRLPFLPPLGMEFSLGVESADKKEGMHILPELIVDRLVFIDHDLSLTGEMGADVHFKPLPREVMEPLLRHFQVSKKWQPG